MSEPEVVRLETAEKYQARVNYWKGRAENAERLLDKERERAQFNDEVRREQIRMARVEAYSLGQLAGLDDYERIDGTLTPNPYRKER